MTEDQMKLKLEQCKRDIDKLVDEKLAIMKRIDAGKEPKWIAAVSRTGGDRLVLHLAKLNSYAKNCLKKAIEKGTPWVSFCNDGSFGVTGYEKDGLTNYRDTKIVF